VRRDSRLVGVAVALVGLAVFCTSAVAPATAGTKKRGPKIVYAEFGGNPDDQTEYRFRVGAARATSVVVELRESPQEGQTTGPKETISLSKTGGTSSPQLWTGFTSKTRSAPCYRAAYIARNSIGRYSLVYRLCIFGHHPEGGGSRAVRVSPW
jgi:hypothetical protein